MMAKIVSQNSAGDSRWFHIHQDVVRELTDTGLLDDPDEVDNSGPFSSTLTKSQIERLIDAKFPRKDDNESWIRVLRKLEANEHHVILKDDAKQIIPLTELRKFRRAFKDFTKPLQREQAQIFANNLGLVKSLWNDSVSALVEYDNQEHFHPESGRKSLPKAPATVQRIQKTTDAAAYFKTACQADDVLRQHGLIYIDREICPLRTRGAKFSDGSPATSSGRGGMDLLLVHHGRICAGEIKIRTDTELFGALVQVLWYASEVASENQIRRVKRAYVDQLKCTSLTETQIDIAIFSIDQPEDPTLEPTLALIRKINEQKGFLRLGEILVLRNNGDGWVNLLA